MGVIKGNRIVYLYRLLADAATTAASAMAFQTENTRSKSRDADTVTTKDGTIRVPGEVEATISTTALFAMENDPIITKLETAVDSGEKVEIWEVNLDVKGETQNSGKYKAKYFQAYVTSFELTSSAEDHAEASLEFAVIGKGADGYATLTEEQEAVASYVYKDTTKEVQEG